MATSVTVTVNDLIKYYGLTEKDCNCEITKVHFEDISRTLVKDWRSLPSRVGMSDISKSDIERDFKTEKERRHAFFSQWKEMGGCEVTYKKLICALLDINNREYAEGVCKLLQKSLHPQQEKLKESVPEDTDVSGILYQIAIFETRPSNVPINPTPPVRGGLGGDLTNQIFNCPRVGTN